MIYQTIFNELTKIVNIETLKRLGHLKFESGGFMDLNFDFLRVDNQDRYVIAISHYYKQNGDMIPDPDMEIRIDNSWDTPTCEALTFQDKNGYQEVYPTINNKEMVYPKLKKSLNSFLLQWIKNIQKQNYSRVNA